MGDLPWYTRLRHAIGSFGFKVFVWSWRTTEGNYIDSVFKENLKLSTYKILRDVKKHEIIFGDDIEIIPEKEEEDGE